MPTGKKHILVTGSTGFIGKQLCAALRSSGYPVREAIRVNDQREDVIPIGDIGPETDWTPALADIEAVIHLAARAHILRETASDPLTEFNRVNVAGTLRLAQMAAQIGVRRFIFVSSIGVNGNQTPLGQPFTEDQQPNPQELYAVSKWEAEQRLWAQQASGQMELVIVRPPLVYGPGAKGNFARLFKLVKRGLPLPLASIHNQRSFIGLTNLTHFLECCIDHPNAANETFLVSDDADVSTPDFITALAQALNQRALLFPCPEGLLRGSARLIGRTAMVDRLVGSLQVDSRKAKQKLGWSPIRTLAEELGQIARGL